MIIYSNLDDVWEHSFVLKNKLTLAGINDKIFTDHLSLRQKITMYKSLLTPKSHNIMINYEDPSHASIKYFKPIKMFNNIISFQDCGDNCFYYTIGDEHILNKNFNDLRKEKLKREKKLKKEISVGWVSSNMAKLQKYWGFIKSLPLDVRNYGTYGIPVHKTVTDLDVQRNWMHSSQNQIHKMDAHICIENSNASGYFSAMPAYALFSGTVPIILGDNLIHRKIFSKDAYIEYNKTHSKLELTKLIQDCLVFINNSKYKDLFTNLYLEYMDFLKKANFLKPEDIKVSKKFRDKLIRI